MTPKLHVGRSIRGQHVWLSAFLIVGALYAATANRGAQWQDSGWQQVRIISGEITHPLGIALTHPLHYYLGRALFRLLPIEPGFAITLLSAFAGAVAVANLTLITWRITRYRWAAVVSGVSLALCHTFWQHATHTESYTIVAALLTAEWLCIERMVATRSARWAALLLLCNGLGVANHMLAALATPVDVVLVLMFFARDRTRLRVIAGGVCLWIVGCLPLLLVMYRDYQTGGHLGATIHSTLFGEFAGSVLNTSFSLRSLARALAFILYNFPGPAIPLAIYGALRHRPAPYDAFRRVLLVQLAIYALFVIRYAIVDQYSFFFVIYLFVAVFAGVGVNRMRERLSDRAYCNALVIVMITALWTPIVYWSTARILAARHVMSSVVGNKPYRDGYRTNFMPWGVGANHAVVLNHQLAELCGNEATIVVEDEMIGFGIEYARAVGRFPTSVSIITLREPQPLPAALEDAGGPIILVPRDRDRPRITTDRTWRRDGDVYVLSNSAHDNSRRAPERAAGTR